MIIQPTTLIGGYMRCGTSMMCWALREGGMDVAFAEEREKLNRRTSDAQYKTNKGGLYELTQKDYMEPGFPKQFEGKVIKVLNIGIAHVCPGNYNCIIMRRDWEEVRQSLNAAKLRKMPCGEEEFQHRMDIIVGIMQQRKDVRVKEVWYRDVVDDPLGKFTELAEWGLPIDPEKAASVVDPRLCRSRKEILVPGA